MRKFALLSCCVLVASLAACESEEAAPIGAPCTTDDDCARGQECTGGTCQVASADTGTDTGNPSLDTDFDATTDTTPDTGGGDACENTCVRTADCGGLGFTNPQCVAGCCEEGTVVGGCEAHLDPCTSSADDNDEFICDTDAGQCLQRCDSDSADDTESADCPLNSYCFELNTPEADLLPGLCLPGDCDSNIFDAEACDGVGTCYPVGNGASYCLEGGTAAVDDACNQEVAEDGSQPTSDICEPGLLCFQGTCIEPCNLRESTDQCEGDLECVRAFDITQRNQPGVCGVECEPFSGGECGGGEGSGEGSGDADSSCQFVGGRFGINAWMCTPIGDATVLDEVGADCTEDGTVCAEGLICLSISDTEAECTPICDPTGATSNAYSDCLADGEICTPSALDGFGFCQEECTPYPRRPGEYDCDTDGDMCIPFTSTDDEPVEPDGFCSPDEGDLAAWEECDNDGFLGAPCADFAVCLSLEEGGAATCLPICEPLGDTGCPDDATCSGVPPLLGLLSFSYCMQDAQAGDFGDRCTEAGLPCAADNSLCVDTGSGNECVKVCRDGFDDCDEVAGTECTVGLFDPAFIPEYMGVCL